MRKLVLLLLTIPLASIAEHHRGHTQMHLEGVIDEMNAAIVRIDTFVDRCPVGTWPDFHQGKLDVIRDYSNRALTDAQYAHSLLYDPMVDLDGVRLLLNAPNNTANYHRYFEILTRSGKRLSVADRIKTVAIMTHGLDYRLRVDGYECAEASILSATPSMIKAWQALDNAIWHNGDSIREEIYQDPAFICSGPNNHCE